MQPIRGGQDLLHPFANTADSFQISPDAGTNFGFSIGNSSATSDLYLNRFTSKSIHPTALSAQPVTHWISVVDDNDAGVNKTHWALEATTKLGTAFTDGRILDLYSNGNLIFAFAQSGNMTTQGIIQAGGGFNSNSGGLNVGGDAFARSITLAAGTTTIAPITLATGSLKTTPLSGDIEYDGTNLYYTNSSNVRQTLATSAGSGANTALSNLTTTSINQNLLPSGNGTRDLGSTSLYWNNTYSLILNLNSSHATALPSTAVTIPTTSNHINLINPSASAAYASIYMQTRTLNPGKALLTVENAGTNLANFAIRLSSGAAANIVALQLNSDTSTTFSKGWTIDATGHLRPVTNNTYNLGSATFNVLAGYFVGINVGSSGAMITTSNSNTASIMSITHTTTLPTSTTATAIPTSTTLTNLAIVNASTGYAAVTFSSGSTNPGKGMIGVESNGANNGLMYFRVSTGATTSRTGFSFLNDGSCTFIQGWQIDTSGHLITTTTGTFNLGSATQRVLGIAATTLDLTNSGTTTPAVLTSNIGTAVPSTAVTLPTTSNTLNLINSNGAAVYTGLYMQTRTSTPAKALITTEYVSADNAKLLIRLSSGSAANIVALTLNSDTSTTFSKGWQIDTSGHLIPVANQTYQLGGAATLINVGWFNQLQFSLAVSNSNNIKIVAANLTISPTISGSNNIVMGSDAGAVIGSGNDNITIGNQAGRQITNGSQNVMIGAQINSTALQSDTSGVVAIGYQAAKNNAASNIVAIGYQALAASTSSFRNTAVGFSAGATGTASDNTYIGYEAGFSATTGDSNTGAGRGALKGNVSGNGNTALGYLAGFDLATGNANTLIGAEAGRSITVTDSVVNSTFLTCIGYGSGQVGITSFSNSVALGYNAKITASNQVQIGDRTVNMEFYFASRWKIDTSGHLIPQVNNTTNVGLTGSRINTFFGTTLNLNGSILLNGSTSGTITIATQATAGTYTLTLPNSAGSANQLLKTDGSGNLSWTTITSGLPFVEVTGTTQTMANDTGYIANNASLVTFPLPTSATVGQIIKLIGKGAGGWKVVQNTGQQIFFGNASTTVSTGYLQSTNQRDSIELVCVTANTDWNVVSAVGSITVV